MGKRFTYKGKDYRVDDDGKIYEDTIFGSEVGSMDKDGSFKIKTGVFSEETGRISSWSGDVYETGMFGGDKGKVGEEKGICFLTTACVEHAGLPDDCPELQLMRKFRDEYIRLLPDGSNLIEDYYRTAPLIVQRIKSGMDADAVLENLLSTVRSVVELIQAGRKSEALAVCKKEFQILKERYRV